MINQNKENSKNQTKVFLGIVFLAVASALYFTYASFSLGEKGGEIQVEKQPISLPSDNADAFEIWRKKLENQNDGITQKLDFLQKSLACLVQPFSQEPQKPLLGGRGLVS